MVFSESPLSGSESLENTDKSSEMRTQRTQATRVHASGAYCRGEEHNTHTVAPADFFSAGRLTVEPQQAELRRRTFHCAHKTRARGPRCASSRITTPGSQCQQPPSTCVSTLDTVHRPPLRSVPDPPQSGQGRTGGRGNGPLNHIR